MQVIETLDFVNFNYVEFSKLKICFMTLIYCYDAYCGWCYGFSPVIKKIAVHFNATMPTEVYSGGMILPETPVHISKTASYILDAYQKVEELTGIKFGEDYLWHLRNPDKTDWYSNSQKPAIAMCIFKEIYPEQAIDFAADLQYALHFEGRDLTDDEAYPHLLEKYKLGSTEFYEKLHSEKYKEEAYYEFSLMKQLQVSGYPAVFVQTGDLKFYQVAKGFTPYGELEERINKVVEEVKI